MGQGKCCFVNSGKSNFICVVFFSAKFLVPRIVADPEYGAQNFVEGVNYYLIKKDD